MRESKRRRGWRGGGKGEGRSQGGGGGDRGRASVCGVVWEEQNIITTELLCLRSYRNGYISVALANGGLITLVGGTPCYQNDCYYVIIVTFIIV